MPVSFVIAFIGRLDPSVVNAQCCCQYADEREGVLIRSFSSFNPFFSWLIQNENVLYLLLGMKPLIYAGLSGDVPYSVFNRLCHSVKVFACTAL